MRFERFILCVYVLIKCGKPKRIAPAIEQINAHRFGLYVCVCELENWHPMIRAIHSSIDNITDPAQFIRFIYLMCTQNIYIYIVYFPSAVHSSLFKYHLICPKTTRDAIFFLSTEYISVQFCTTIVIINNNNNLLP